MSGDDARVGQQFTEALFEEADRFDAVVQEINLSAAGEFPFDRVADETFVIAADDGLDRDAVGRRGLDGAHVARAEERKVKRARDGSGGEGEHVDAAEIFLQPLLVQDAETLFLVDDDQAEIFEGDILAEEAVGADHDVHAPVAQSGERLLLLLRRAKTAEQADGHRIIGHAFAQGLPMLLGQHGGGREEGDLLAAHHGFEGRADGDFRFAETDVAADETVHRFGRFHVLLGIGDGAELVGRLLEGE